MHKGCIKPERTAYRQYLTIQIVDIFPDPKIEHLKDRLIRSQVVR